MIASILPEEQLTSGGRVGYARLVSEARQHECRESESVCGESEILDDFDELVAAKIVSRLRNTRVGWSLRATGEVVLDVLQQSNLLSADSLAVPARELVQRAHRIARQIIPSRMWAEAQ